MCLWLDPTSLQVKRQRGEYAAEHPLSKTSAIQYIQNSIEEQSLRYHTLLRAASDYPWYAAGTHVWLDAN
jgi:hypothetical protein